jgi:N-acetylneuraminate synthase/N,N'-diacetyllegionaminate synthase
MTIAIDSRTIGEGNRPYIIAEAGINFLNDVRLGKAFIEEAAAAGADAIKFQTHIASAEMVRDEMDRIGRGDVYDVVEENELSVADHEALQSHCAEHGITFLSTPFSVAGVERLADLNVPAIKIGSGELTDSHILREASQLGNPLLVSTGMATQDDVRETVQMLESKDADYALFYCVSEYPTSIEDVHLDTIAALRSEFGVPIGFSDHTQGIEAAAVAMARGADIIEKHFTIDRALPGPDQVVSVEPSELEKLVEYAEVCQSTRGGRADITAEESETQQWARHSVVTAEPIAEGETLTTYNLTTKRPNTGIPARKYYDVIGSKATRRLDADEILTQADIDGA